MNLTVARWRRSQINAYGADELSASEMLSGAVTLRFDGTRQLLARIGHPPNSEIKQQGLCTSPTKPLLDLRPIANLCCCDELGFSLDAHWSTDRLLRN